MAFPVLFDTCAIFGAPLFDLLLNLADEGAFRPLWSPDILDELERNLGARVGEDLARKRVGAMRTAFPDAEVRGYETLVEQMTCDAKDRHVLAAAVRANAEVLVTFNLKDFPVQSTLEFDVQVVHPDDFLLDQLDLFPPLVVRTLESVAAYYERPAMTVHQLLEMLAKHVPRFVAEVESYF